MSLAIFQAVSTLGLSWVYAKMPLFGTLIAEQRFRELDRAFWPILLRSTGMTVIAAAGVVIAVAMADAGAASIPVVDRMSSLSVLLPLAVCVVINVSINAMATYMRAHKREPMTLQSVTSAILITAVALLSTSAQWMMLGYAAVVALVALPWTIVLFIRFRSAHEMGAML